MQVYKFGGASVKDVEGIRNLERIIANTDAKKLLVVVSAMGKTTNALEKVVQAHYHQTGQAFTLLQAIKLQHKRIAENMQLHSLLHQGLLDDLFVEAEWLLEDSVQDTYDYLYDQIVALGELLATRIVAAYLQQKGHPVVWMDVRDVIKTDDTYRSATVDWDSTKEKVREVVRPHTDADRLVITQGFIASTSELNTITLGREGSDFTGAILASLLRASSYTVWKDVPGVMTTDPDFDQSARLIPRLDYLEALEMTYYGAKVIHPKTIKPLMDASIPMWVRSFQDPYSDSTLVASFPDEKYPSIKVVLHHQTLLRLSSLDFKFVVEDHLSEVFQLAVKHKIEIHYFKNLALSLSLVISPAPEHQQPFIHDLERTFKVSQKTGLELFTIRHFEIHEITKLKESGSLMIEEYSGDTAQLLVEPDLSVGQRRAQIDFENRREGLK